LAAVTGGTGFLGRYVVSALAAAGWRVRLLARKRAGHPQLAGLDLQVIAGDLSDGRALRELVAGAEVVIHVAGLIKARTAAEFREVNVGGSANLAAAVKDRGAGARVLMVSSIAAREPRLSTYAQTKREGEEQLTAVLGARSDWLIVRPCAVYGPWDIATLPIFRAVGRGIVVRPRAANARVALIHAVDAAQAIATLCDRGPAGSILELTDERPEGYSWKHIIATAATALQVEARCIPLPAVAFRTAGVINLAAAWALRRTPMLTPGKARELLHPDWGSTAGRQPPAGLWQPAIGLQQGFRDTVDWYRARHWLPARSPAWLPGVP
jgi:nucleoside-diphosphate-sugar epimerase